jgi:TPP-dependent pyruvate/acetoin dehydrogenase alpha subunit
MIVTNNEYGISTPAETQHGEKNIADKHEVPSPIIMSGTKVLTGEGKMVVLAVG